MDKTLYERSLEALVEKLEAENARLREMVSGTSDHRPERFSGPTEITLPSTASDGIGFADRAALDSATLFQEHKSTPPPENKIAKRASEAEKRELLTAHGWSVHPEVEDQNIRVCWEHGAQWYSLEDAYELAIKDLAREKLRRALWSQMTDPVSGDEAWSAPGTNAFVPLHQAIHAIGAAQVAPQIHPDQLVAS
jgi:hypothetical protein